jgi:hypothetical protein
MSSKGNGFIFYVPRNITLTEVDSKDVLFDETFHDVRDRHGKIVEHGTALTPDLVETQGDKYVHVDGHIKMPNKLPQLPVSNRFEALTDLDDVPLAPTVDLTPVELDSPTIKETTPAPIDTPAQLTPPPAAKRWHYVPVTQDGTRGDRRNDGPKSASFFKIPPPVDGPNHRSSRTTNTAPALLAASPKTYNPALDILMSGIESRSPPDVCLMSTPSTTALHATFSGDLDGPDPKSQKKN